MTDLFVESLRCEIDSFFENYDAEIARIRCEYQEELGCIAGVFEAGNENQQSSGGIGGLISSMLSAIAKFLKDAASKLKKLLFGAKAAPGKENENVNLKRNPDAVIKFLDKSYKDHKDVLQKAKAGKLSIEDAKAFVKKQDDGFSNIKGGVFSLVSALTLFAGKGLILDRWAKEAEEMKKQFEETSGNASERVANNLDPKNREAAANEAAKLIIDSYNSQTKRGIMSILNPLKEFYQKGFLSNSLKAEAEESMKKGATLKRVLSGKKEARELNKQANEVNAQGRRRGKYYGADKKAIEDRSRARENLTNSQRRNFTDVAAKAAEDGEI